MIVWGGQDSGQAFRAPAGRYNPSTDSWVSHQHHKRAHRPDAAHGSVDWQRDDRLGRIQTNRLFEHRREIQSQHGQLDRDQHR